MRSKLLAALATLLVLTTACSDRTGEAYAFDDLEPFRAIEQLDDQGRPYLSPWDVDPAVAELQQLAVDAGLPVDVTGVYDDDTLAIVLAFQYSQDLVPDGVVGPLTWDAIDDPKDLPEDIELLTLVEIAQVSFESGSDALRMLDDLGLPPPLTTPSEPGSESGGGEGSSEPEEPSAPAGSGAAAVAVVTLDTQMVDILDADGNLLHRFPVSSGRDGLTPVGSFKVQSKSEIAYSATDYPDISMQWMTRFNGGIGFHGIPVKNGEQLDTPLGVRPVSAGCIRMDDDDAKVLYDILPVGADVIVRA